VAEQLAQHVLVRVRVRARARARARARVRVRVRVRAKVRARVKVRVRGACDYLEVVHAAARLLHLEHVAEEEAVEHADVVCRDVVLVLRSGQHAPHLLSHLRVRHRRVRHRHRRLVALEHHGSGPVPVPLPPGRPVPHEQRRGGRLHQQCDPA